MTGDTYTKYDIDKDAPNPNDVTLNHNYALHVLVGLLKRYFQSLLQLNDSTDFKTPSSIMYMARQGGINHIRAYQRIARQIDLDSMFPKFKIEIEELIEKLQAQGILEMVPPAEPSLFIPKGKTHVADWANNAYENDPINVRYARWWLLQSTMPATMEMYFAPVMADFQLYATHEGRRFRVTGSSALGDVWLHSNHARTDGYEYRVYVDDCTDWSKTP